MYNALAIIIMEEEKRNEELEREILATAGIDIVRDYELLRCEDFRKIWGE